ncbi:hypothetical protein HPO96_09570 [Kribbella sandramycini]|uniref:Uncharacterized protein n=1 Tax=Kribbella sandramycini TaxID=60450 RepID=A0A7Y4KXI8_9ACTN|nr:hypothetical protein [Kribbella sandramycini]MBB6569676.1 hypothetical protein [Kribbella sandramycini]NOL40492.1 hypothetical protein [Kribbella sandramycini]
MTDLGNGNRRWFALSFLAVLTVALGITAWCGVEPHHHDGHPPAEVVLSAAGDTPGHADPHCAPIEQLDTAAPAQSDTTNPAPAAAAPVLWFAGPALPRGDVRGTAVARPPQSPTALFCLLRI